MRLKAGSLQPDLVMTLLDEGVALSGLDGPSVVVTMVGVQGAGELFRKAADVIDPDTGEVTHRWVTAHDDTLGETDIRGRIFCTAEVNLGDGKLIVFPPYGEVAVDIE